jgi:hypothetical protein
MKTQRFLRRLTTLFFLTFLTASAALSEEIILMEEEKPASTPTASVPQTSPAKGVPTATPTLPPLPENMRTQEAAKPSAPPPPKEAPPAPVEKKKNIPAVEKEIEPGAEAEVEVKEEAPVVSAEDEDLSPEARWLKHAGFLQHPRLIATVDGLFDLGVGPGADAAGLNAGFGFTGRLELQFFTWLALGTYYDFAIFPTTGGRLVYTGPWGLMARFMPFNTTGKFTPYFFGGLGINSMVSTNAKPYYPTSFHGFAGVGGRMDFGDKWGLDLGLIYNYFSPQSNPLQAIGARVGLSYEVGL